MSQILKKGSKGEGVSHLHIELLALGYEICDNEINPKLFGEETLKAVSSFQTKNLDKQGHPLIISGVVGSKTWWSLLHANSLFISKTIDNN